ncbi:MAG: hypothetical protein U0636_07295 [Phycisphaerales bacterium]
MNDSLLPIGRLFMLVFVPVMLLVPLVFALLVPNRVTDDAGRLKARGRVLLLTCCTVLALALWVGLLLAGLRFAWAMSLASFWWTLFFPLWFFLAMPAVIARNPAWGGRSGAVGQTASAGAFQEDTIRTASLMNRERQSPISRGMWAVPVLVLMVALGAMAARGFAPFPEDTQAAAAERARWLFTLCVYGGVFVLQLAILPYTLRRTLTEPEPLDARGSAALKELYRVQRRRRVLGLFWGGGVLLPAFLGLVLGLTVWFPMDGSAWGLLGGIGGAAIGLAGAAFGIWMTVERARIAAVRRGEA